MGRSFAGYALSGIAAVAILACVPASAGADEPYAINIVLPLSGSGAFLGKQQQHALEIQEKVVNLTGGIQGRPMQYVFHDDQSSPQIAVQLLNDVMAAKPPVVVGSSLVAACNAMMPEVQQEGPVQYCISPGFQPPPGGFAFSGTVSTHDLQVALLRYFRLQGKTRIAVITSTDATGQDAERGITSAMQLPENQALTLVENSHFNPTDVSVSAQMARIGAAHPDLLIAWSTGTPIATVLKGVIQAGLDIPVATTNGNQTFAQMAQYEGFLPKQLFIPSAEWPNHPASITLDPKVEAAHKVMFDAFAESGEAPDGGSILAWDPAMIVVDALRKLGTGATPAQLKNYLLHLKDYGGVAGLYDFERIPVRGLDVAAAAVTRWNPGQKQFEMVSQPGGIPIGQ